MKQLKLWLTIHTPHSLVLLVLAAAILPFLVLGHASAVSKTWDGGCGADTTWSCANNWSDNIVPGAGDTVTFNATSTNNSVVDASFAGTITTININSGYTGTISLSRSLTVSTTFSQAAGTFNAGSQTLTLAAFTLSAGSFTASSGTTNISGAMTISGSPTFSANGGTMNFNGSTSATLSCNSVSFNLVTFTQTAGTKTVSSNCSLPLGSNPSLGSAGQITLNGTLSGSGTLNMSAGTLALQSGSALSGFSGLTVASLTLSTGASYNFGSYSPFTVSGTFILSTGATMTLPSGTASFGGTYTVNSGSTFNANGGTVNFNGTTSATLACGSKTFNLVTFTNTSGTKTVSSDCSLPLGANPNANSGGSITNNGTLSGTGTFTTSGTFTFGVGSTVSGFTGRVAVNLTINGTANYGSYTTFTVSGIFTVNSGGIFTAPTGTASFSSTFTLNSGSTFNANGGTIDFNGTGSSSLTISCGNKSFNLVTFTHTHHFDIVSSDCNLPLGNNPYASGSISLNGTLSATGTFTENGSLTLGSTGVLSGPDGLVVEGAMIINGPYDFSSYSPFSVTGSFTLNSTGVFTAPTGVASFGSTFTLNSGSIFNANGGTVNFTGNGGIFNCNNATFNLVTFTAAGGKTIQGSCLFPLGNNPTVDLAGILAIGGTLSGTGTINVTGTSGSTFRPQSPTSLSGFSGLVTVSNLTINNTVGTVDFTGYSPFTIAGTLQINAGSAMTAPSGITSVGGDFTNNGTFNANGGTVVFDGSSQSIVGDVSFYNLTKTVSSSDTLTFTAGNTVTVTGLLTLKGGSGGLLSLVSSVPGSAWFLNALGTTNVSYVDVADSNASGGKTIAACNSADGGNNTNWDINPASCYPSSGGSSATSAITNYMLLQASIAAQNQQTQNATAGSAASDANLPSKIYDFIRQFPHRKELAKAIGQFLLALVIGIIIGMLILIFLLWRRRLEQDREDREDLAAESLAATTPPAEPGTTVMPTRPTPVTPPLPPDNPDKKVRP